MSKGQNARPKRAKKDTEKIKPFRTEVKKQKAQRKSRKRSKAQREDYSLDPQSQENTEGEDEDQESDLPDANEVGRSTSGQETRREVLVRKLQAHGDFDVSEMDNTELETVWAKVKRSKDANKRKLFGKTSKVIHDAPARPAISPNKKRGRSPSPNPISNKRSQSEVDTRKQPESKSKGSRSESHLKKPAKSSNPRSSVSHASSRSSSRAPSSARSSNVRRSKDVDLDEEEEEKEDNEDSNGHRDEDEDEDRSDDDSQLNESDGSSDRPVPLVKHRSRPKKGPKGKVRSGDFTGTERILLDETVHLVECHLLLVNYFLGPQDLFVVIKEMWETAVRKQKEKLKNFLFCDEVFEAVKDRIHSFRGRLRGTVLVAGGGLLNAYGLKGCSQGSAEAIKVIDSILPHGVHVKPGSQRGYGFFQHEFILEAIYQILFTGRHPLGHRYPEKFQVFPPRLVTLTCSITHGVLDKYKLELRTGNKNKDEQLSLADVLSYYKIHQKTMKLFELNQNDRFKIVLPLLSQRCFEWAGIDQSAPVVQPRAFKALTAEDFAHNEPTKEEIALLRLPTKTAKAVASQSTSPTPNSLPKVYSSDIAIEETRHSDTKPPSSSTLNKESQRPKPKARPVPSTDDSDLHDEHNSGDSPSVPPAAAPKAIHSANIPTAPISSATGSGLVKEHTLSPKETMTESPLKPSTSRPLALTTPSTIKSANSLKSPRQKGLVVELSTKPVRKGPATAKKLHIINRKSTAKSAD